MAKNINLLEDDVRNMIKQSKYKILDYKSDLFKLHSLIFEYCSLHNIFLYHRSISNIYNENQQSEIDIYAQDNEIELFSIDPKQDALKLVNLIYKNYSKFVSLTSYLHDNEQIIFVDNNRTIVINLLFSKNMISPIIPIKILNKTNSHILLLPNEITMFFILKKLYHPSLFLKYINNNLIEYENKSYYDTFNNLIQKYHVNDNYFQTAFKSDKIINSLYSKILNILYNNGEKYIILDNVAIEIIKNEFNSGENEINISKYNIQTSLTISSNNNIIVKIIQNKINEYLKLQNIKFDKLYYTVSDSFVYDDFRLKKISLIIQIKNVKYNLLHVFNNISYEIVPIIIEKNNFLIPHPFVIYRFLLYNYINMFIYSKYVNSVKLFNFSNYNIQINNLDTIYYYGDYKDEKLDKYKIGSNVFRPNKLF